MTDEINRTAKVHQVLIWLLEGASHHQITETIGKEWPEDDSSKLILDALTELRNSGNQSHVDVQNWAFEATKLIYLKTMEIGDYGDAMRAIRQMLQISSNRAPSEQPPKRVQNKSEPAGHLNDDDDDIEAQRLRLAARIDRLGADA